MRSMSEVNLWEIENGLKEQGVGVICGVDEAGRGPLAGPVCAAAVILPEGELIPGLNDSKKLTDKKRRELFPIIKEKAIAYGIAFASEQEIDEINILQATFLAMKRAIGQLEGKADFALIDGNRETDFGVPCLTVVKGDSRSANIAAASVLAKVTRDIYMEELAEQYPQYGFEIHKGYGTKAHYAALTEHGMCDAHRRTFLKKFYGEK
ncbi:MAG: ribonuclease HII [Ruminococcaceae bacterium]|nr:ribonuclease HII [Oscillospiraceae bacterium]